MRTYELKDSVFNHHCVLTLNFIVSLQDCQHILQLVIPDFNRPIFYISILLLCRIYLFLLLVHRWPAGQCSFLALHHLAFIGWLAAHFKTLFSLALC